MEFFSRDFSGSPFRLFSRSHLAALAAVSAVNLALFPLRPLLTAAPRVRHIVRWGVASLLLANEASWHLWNLSVGRWHIQTMLPLHLCSTMVFASSALLLTGNRTLYEFVYFAGLGGAMQAIITPGLRDHDFPHFCYFQTFISHGGIILTALYMTIVEGYRPTPASLLRVFLGIQLALLPIALVNRVTGGNYCYIARKPDIPTLIDKLGPWPWYIIPMQLIGVGMLALLYLPFAWSDWKTWRDRYQLRRDQNDGGKPLHDVSLRN